MKHLLFSVTKKDFDWHYFRGTGSGGQKKNKTASACRCVHRDSGAVGVSQEDRKQSENRKIAFNRCVKTKEFQNWIKATTAAIAAGQRSIEAHVDKLMDEKNIKVETYTPHGLS